MPSPETVNRHQKAVLWAANGYDTYGDIKVSANVEIDVRWEEKRREILDPQGNSITIEAEIVVDRDITIGSIMWLGNKVDLATPPVDLKQVVAFNKTPDIKGLNYRRTVSVIRFSNELPTIA